MTRDAKIKENNKRVLERMKNPKDTLMTCEVDALWWQPRPINISKIAGWGKKESKVVAFKCIDNEGES